MSSEVIKIWLWLYTHNQFASLEERVDFKFFYTLAYLQFLSNCLFSSYLSSCLLISLFTSTGSLLENPYPFSPGTSPEPTSPVIPAGSPETVYPIGSVESIQNDAEMDTRMSKTGSGAYSTASITCTHGSAFSTGPMDCTSQILTSGTEPTCVTATTKIIAKNTNFTTEQLTSSTEPALNCGPKGARGSTGSHAGYNTSATETFTLTELAKFNTSTASSAVSASQEPLNFTMGITTTGTDSTSITGPSLSNQEYITSTPVATCFSVPACASGSIPGCALLESLEQLAQRGDDSHLPQSLHQVLQTLLPLTITDCVSFELTALKYFVAFSHSSLSKLLLSQLLINHSTS